MHEHIVGMIGGKSIREGGWCSAVQKFKGEVDRFNNSKRAVPHPGIIQEFSYCPECGASLENHTYLKNARIQWNI